MAFWKTMTCLLFIIAVLLFIRAYIAPNTIKATESDQPDLFGAVMDEKNGPCQDVMLGEARDDFPAEREIWCLEDGRPIRYWQAVGMDKATRTDQTEHLGGKLCAVHEPAYISWTPESGRNARLRCSQEDWMMVFEDSGDQNNTAICLTTDNVLYFNRNGQRNKTISEDFLAVYR